MVLIRLFPNKYRLVFIIKQDKYKLSNKLSMLRTIKGLENVIMTRPGYNIITI